MNNLSKIFRVNSFIILEDQEVEDKWNKLKDIIILATSTNNLSKYIRRCSIKENWLYVASRHPGGLNWKVEFEIAETKNRKTMQRICRALKRDLYEIESIEYDDYYIAFSEILYSTRDYGAFGTSGTLMARLGIHYR